MIFWHVRSIYFLIGPFPASFPFIIQLIVNKIVDDWIGALDLWCRKQQLYQLSHNHCQYSLSFSDIVFLMKPWKLQ